MRLPKVFLFFALCVTLPAVSQELPYELINPPVPTETPDKIEVVELFW